MKWKYLLAAATLAAPASAFSAILFVSHNTPAEDAVTKLLLDDDNYPTFAVWMADDLANDGRGRYSDFKKTEQYLDETEIPGFASMLEKRLASLNLRPEDPADKGFTDYLTAMGYDVVRSETTVVVDGETETLVHEYETTLTPELVAELEAFDLIIFSRDVGSGFGYSLGGNAAEGALQRIQAWNSLSTPMLVMNHQIITGSEWDFRWGWSYGYTRSNPDRVTSFNARDAGLLDPLTLAVEVWEPQDPLLDGITVGENFLIDIYVDGVFGPSVHSKFSNNENYEFGAGATMIAEYVVPNFEVITDDGTLDIETKDPVLMRFEPNQTLFTLEAPSTRSEFSGLSNSEIAQTVGADRVYFAAGMHEHGIFALNENGRTILLNAVEDLSGIPAQPVSVPVIFVSNNTAARTAVEKLVVDEENYPTYAVWMENDINAGNRGRYSDFKKTEEYLDATEIVDFDAKVAVRMTELGLSDALYADEGFTDFLRSNGYVVWRAPGSTVAGSPDPFFEGPLTEEKRALLENAEVVIFSRDVNTFAYSLGGSAAEGALTRIEDWNGLTTPMIVMNHQLITGSEWDFRWGWSYGYTRNNPDTLTKFNARDAGLLAPIPYAQEVWEPNDPLLDGITIPNDFIIDLYDDEIFMPSVHNKFSNNENFEFGSAATMIVEYVVPNFEVVTDDGTLDIETKDPVLMRFEPGQMLFTLEAASTRSEFSGLSNSELAQQVAAERIYYAAGMHDHGIYNLNENGETVLLNAVGAYASPSGPSCDADWALAGHIGSWFVSDSLGWIYAQSEVWGYSTLFGPIYTGFCNPLYQVKEGWLFHVGTSADAIWFYSPTRGWVYTPFALNGWFAYSMDGSSWAWAHFTVQTN